MIRKLLIVPWFGLRPEWYDDWRENIRALEPFGYDLLLVEDEKWFTKRVAETLGVTYPGGDGRKTCDYRCCFGIIFNEEIDGYDFWGHTDMDVVYGRVDHWMTDELLSNYDIIANHHDYISGPWTLYRNCAAVNILYQRHPDWWGHLENPRTTGWVEQGYTHIVDEAHEEGIIRRLYGYWQAENLNDFSRVWMDDDGTLLEGPREVMLAHFRRTKEYPVGCR